MLSKRVVGSLAAITALSATAVLYQFHGAGASDHQDSPAVVARPAADITDVYAFPSPSDASKIELVMDVHPLIPAGMAEKFSFDPGVLYQFKIAHGPVGSGHQEDTVFQIVPQGSGDEQKLALYVNTDPGTMVGPKDEIAGNLVGTFPFDNVAGTSFSDGIKAYAGPRADPFFFDLFQFFKILPDRYYKNPRTGDKLGTPTPTFNGFPRGSKSGPGGYACSTAPSMNALTQVGGGFNVLSIVLEVPRASLSRYGSPIAHLWETTSLPTSERRDGKVVYQQIELLSRPVVKELFETFDSHAITNVRSPYFDSEIPNSVSYFMSHVAGRSAAISKVVTSVLYPNEMLFDVSKSGNAAYLGVETGGKTGGKFGGRGLTDDVIDTSLGVVFGNTIPALGLAPDDHKENNCLTNEHVYSGQGGRQTQPGFPYLATPH